GQERVVQRRVRQAAQVGDAAAGELQVAMGACAHRVEGLPVELHGEGQGDNASAVQAVVACVGGAEHDGRPGGLVYDVIRACPTTGVSRGGGGGSERRLPAGIGPEGEPGALTKPAAPRRGTLVAGVLRMFAPRIFLRADGGAAVTLVDLPIDELEPVLPLIQA